METTVIRCFCRLVSCLHWLPLTILQGEQCEDTHFTCAEVSHACTKNNVKEWKSATMDKSEVHSIYCAQSVKTENLNAADFGRLFKRNICVLADSQNVILL